MTDEPEQVSQIKINRIFTYLYVDLCRRLIYQDFECEGCEKNWPSQRDHVCCILSEYEIFNQHYDDIKNRVDFELFHQLHGWLAEIACIPISLEITQSINQLINMSSENICSMNMRIEGATDKDDIRITELVQDLSERIVECLPLDFEIYPWLKDYLRD